MTIVSLQKQRKQHWSAMEGHSSDNCKLTKAKNATLECNGRIFKRQITCNNLFSDHVTM